MLTVPTPGHHKENKRCTEWALQCIKLYFHRTFIITDSFKKSQKILQNIVRFQSLFYLVSGREKRWMDL